MTAFYGISEPIPPITAKNFPRRLSFSEDSIISIKNTIKITIVKKVLNSSIKDRVRSFSGF